MYTFLAYPLDVIKTNRILLTSFSKKGGESIPKELVALYERGPFYKELYRGFLFYFLASSVEATLSATTQTYKKLMYGIVATAIANPLNVFLVHKQAINNDKSN